MPTALQYRAAVRRFQRGAAISAVVATLSFLALELLVPQLSESWHRTALYLTVLTLALAVYGACAFITLWIVWAYEGKRSSGERR